MERSTLYTRLEKAARALPDARLRGLVAFAEFATHIDADAAAAQAPPAGELHPEFQRIAVILHEVEYKTDIAWRVAPDGSWLQAVRVSRDAATGQPAPTLYGRKWRLSARMVRSEVVQTALAAVLAFEEHEARELFRWRGRAIFGPHIDLDALHAAASSIEGRPTHQEAI